MSSAIVRLRQRAEFLRVAAAGNKFVAGTLIVQMDNRPEQAESAAGVGFTVSSRVGGAVVRNRVRRRLKAALEGAVRELRDGHDYVVIGRKAALDCSYEQIKTDLSRALTHLHRRRSSV